MSDSDREDDEARQTFSLGLPPDGDDEDPPSSSSKRGESPSSVVPPAAAVELPVRLGKYELALELASGGFGSVHLARVVGPGAYEKFVALKLIHPHLSREESFVTMFLDEARIAASINHPNVCSAIDFGEVDGVLYLAMDFLVGEPLSNIRKLLRQNGDVTPVLDRFALVSRVVADAAEGLHAAHESVGPDGEPLGIVHRDVAPPNLFIRYDGGVQVMDFGVAKAAGQMHVTAQGIAKGHIAYVAPEQLAQRRFDRRVDIWSLGVVLWEMLTLRRLFVRESIESTLFAIARDAPPPPSSIDPRIPRALDDIVMKALKRDPDERYPTARAMGDALLGFVARCDVPTGPSRVSAWMDEMFPTGREDNQRLFDRAREILGPPRRDETPRKIIRRISSRPAALDGVITDAPSIPPPPKLPGEALRGGAKTATDADDEAPTSMAPHPREVPARVTPRLAASIWVGAALLSAAAGIAAGLVLKTDTAPEDPPSPPASAPAAEPEPPLTDYGAVVPFVLPPAAVIDAGIDTGVEAQAVIATGFVNIVTPGGWAEIFQGTQSYGPTPGRVELPVGSWRIRLVPTGGGAPHYVQVDVRAGEVTRVVVPLGATAPSP